MKTSMEFTVLMLPHARSMAVILGMASMSGRKSPLKKQFVFLFFYFFMLLSSIGSLGRVRQGEILEKAPIISVRVFAD